MKTLERKSGDKEIRSRTSHRIISPWIQNHFLPWPHLWQSVWRHPCRKCHILDGAPPNRLCLKSTARSLWWWPLICPWDFDGNKTQIETFNVNTCWVALAPKEKATASKSFYPFTILYLKKLQNYSPRLGTVIFEAFSSRKRDSRRYTTKKKKI